MVSLDPNADQPTWLPPGMEVPKQTPTSVIALSPSLAHLAVNGSKKQQDVWRCPVCGTPYKTQAEMGVCAEQPFDRTVQNSLGLDVGDPITFLYIPRKVEDLIFAKRIREDEVPDKDLPKFIGKIVKWIAVRSPRGHEPMPVVQWINSSKPLESWLVPKPPNNVMCASPSRTRDRSKISQEF